MPEGPAQQYILLTSALDATAFFTEFAETVQNGPSDRDALNAFGSKWQVEFLGPPLNPTDLPTGTAMG